MWGSPKKESAAVEFILETLWGRAKLKNPLPHKGGCTHIGELMCKPGPHKSTLIAVNSRTLMTESKSLKRLKEWI